MSCYNRHSNRKAALDKAFEYADDYVLQNTSCATLADIAHGWCDVWAKAVKQQAPFVEVCHSSGHWYVVYNGVAYDSDTSDEGFEPPKIALCNSAQHTLRFSVR